MSFRYSHTLTPQDYKNAPVWESDLSQEHTGFSRDTLVKPVTMLPVDSMVGRFIGTEVTFANGSKSFAVIFGLDASRYVPISSFILYKDDAKFVYRKSSLLLDSERLATFLQLTIEEIFPIEYDVSKYILGDNVIARGQITMDSPSIPEGMSRKDYFKKILIEQRKQQGNC